MSKEFKNKISDGATLSKKGNMAYWDSIDELAEEYVRQLLEFNTSVLKVDTDEDEDDVFIDISKEITELAIKLLEERFGAYFPYVDENY